MGFEAPSLSAVQRAMSAHEPLYSWRRPIYQAEMLAGLADALHGPGAVLDVGGGTGLMAQVIQDLFPGAVVTAVDVQDRFLPNLSVQTSLFNGTSLPFDSGSFDCAILLNVLHHVPPPHRVELVSECLRVTGGGPLHIKDHLSEGPLDDRRLWTLDMLGNALFGGMIDAQYLRHQDWAELARRTGCVIAYHPVRAYRRLPLAAVFPNRLEIMMSWNFAT
jgi:ubiquinone/menaquinone biosynthesis C-methylase UbiE